MIASFPLYSSTEFVTQAVFTLGKKVAYCGGYSSLEPSGTRKCHTLDLLTNQWRQSGLLREAKALAGFSVHPTLGLIISGGVLPSRGQSDSVESTKDGASFRQHASLPVKTHYHCQARSNCSTFN